jgi:protease-4
MQMANLEQLMKKVGVDYVVIKAGQFKDVGNFSRPMTPEERRVLQAVLDDIHGQFIRAVAEGRKLDPAQVARFADGRIFSGEQAKGLGMIDELGGLEEAVNQAAQLARLPLPARVTPPRRRFSIFDLVRSELGIGHGAVLAPALPVFKTPLYLMD